MKKKSLLVSLFVFAIANLYGQSKSNSSYYFSPEFLIGKTMEANTDFPKTKLQTSLFLSLGQDNTSSDEEWARQLGYPKTGLTLGITNFGNSEKLGRAYSILPFMEFGLFQKNTDKWNFQIGIGASYTDTQYHISNNPHNKGVSTKFNWSFKSFFYYDAFRKKETQWRVGLGYLHHSNGHSRLPNQGLNSFLLSLSSKFDFKTNTTESTLNSSDYNKTKSTQNYFSLRSGIGLNVLSQVYNDKKEVYSIAISAGKILNNTFKFGGGAYYRFYEKYYDYIKENGALLEEQEPHFKDHPFKYATNFGVSGSAELLINHIGVEFDIGINFYKPFYKFDWQLSQGYVYTTMVDGEPKPAVVIEELNSYYKLKRTVSSRLGLKYYFITTNKAPKHNVFLGAHINANLGQADFTELSLGYVYRFNLKDR